MLSGWGPLIGLRVSASRYLWRPGPAWAVLAGAIASGAPLLSGEALLRVFGLVLLADSAWGAVWAPIIGADPSVSPAAMPRRETTSWPLPYMQPGAPADQMRGMTSGARWHDLFVAALLTGGLAVLLGLPALIISVAALGVTLWALFVAQWEAQPALPRALLNVGLPWLLGLTLAYGTPAGSVGLPVVGLPAAALLLGAAFTLLEWGAQRAGGSHDSRARGVWMGQAAVLLVLIGLRLPWTTAVAAALLLPPSWFWLRLNGSSQGWGDASIRVATLIHSVPWWWAALMLSALALR
jgi:hypothetical protein